MTTSKHAWTALTLTGVMALTALPVSANVVLGDDALYGAGAVIRDVTNSRDFLRLDFTTPYTYNQVLGNLGSGGLFAGWSIATEAQMQALGTSASIGHGSTDPVQILAAEQLRDWFCVSCVETSTTHVYARGLLADSFLVDHDSNGLTPELLVQEAFSIGRRLNVTPNEVDFRVSGWYYQDSKLSPNEGIYLSRATIPEPASAWLLAAAAMGFGALRRARRT